ncbi:MAG: hypothetical protein MJ003_04905 [Paludibacteraceae bacterium]|nr:hypothetical protein [Paludibacteraceae bacterium]
MDKNLTIKERILLFAESQHIKKECLYQQIGVAASNFKGIGLKSEIGGSLIVKFLTQFPNVNSDWLLTGNGEMLKTCDVQNRILPESCSDCLLLKSKDETIAALQNHIKSLQSQTPL